MMAFLVPVVWMFTGVGSAGLLYSFMSWAGVTSLVLDNWKLRKLAELGIDPETVRQVLEPDEAARLRAMAELGISQNIGAKHGFELEETPWAVKHGFTGKWLLLDEEVEQFFDGMRHVSLVEGEGQEAEDLKALLVGRNVKYEELKFLWEGFHCDFAKLRKVSDARLADPEWTDVVSYLRSRRTSKA